MAGADQTWSEQLEPVVRFLNTAVAGPGDPLATDAGCRFWLADRGYAAASATPYRELLVDLRAALRAAVPAAPDGRSPTEPRRLGELIERCQAVVRFEVGPQGLTWALTGPAGAPRYAAELLTVLTHATVSGAWSRVRLCPGDGCGLVFVDTTRAARRTWCSMARCGNRAKQARWRAQASPAG